MFLKYIDFNLQPSILKVHWKINNQYKIEPLYHAIPYPDSLHPPPGHERKDWTTDVNALSKNGKRKN